MRSVVTWDSLIGMELNFDVLFTPLPDGKRKRRLLRRVVCAEDVTVREGGLMVRKERGAHKRIAYKL